MDSQLFALILAGGSGTRFWPLSRKSNPKQLLALVGDQPIINSTIARLDGLVDRQNVRIICGPSLHESTQKVTTKMNVDRFIIEPAARNTAPAIFLAAAMVAREAPDAILAFLPSDHVIQDEAAFRGILAEAATLARSGPIVTLGIQPTRPETGFGYIKRTSTEMGAGFEVERFVEKPDAETAKGYVDSGAYFWNAGIFVTTASTLFDELAAQLPDSHRAFQAVVSADEDSLETAINAAFEATPATSIDYAIMENAKSIAVIPADCGWSDVGHWAALPEVLEADNNGNISRGSVVAIRTRDSILVNYATNRVLTVSDMDAVIAVQTEDSTMIVPRAHAQSVRDIVQALQQAGLQEYL